MDARLYIERFDVSFYHNDLLMQYRSKGPKLTPEQVAAFDKLERSTAVVFKNIVVRSYRDDRPVAEPFVLFVEVEKEEDDE